MRFTNTIMIVGVAVVALFNGASAAVTSNTVTLPSKTLVTAFVADLNGATSVVDQWRSGSMVTLAWDFSINCFSEQWITGGPTMGGPQDGGQGGQGGQASMQGAGNGAFAVTYGRVTCGGKTIINQGSKCNPPVTDTTVQSTAQTAYYTQLFNVTEGLVNDPFRPHSTEQLTLWKNPSNKSWMWLNVTTGAPVYIQDVRADLKRTVVFYLPDGLTGTGVSSYNFQNFVCAK
jgi:hypothetical protein